MNQITFLSSLIIIVFIFLFTAMILSCYFTILYLHQLFVFIVQYKRNSLQIDYMVMVGTEFQHAFGFI